MGLPKEREKNFGERDREIEREIERERDTTILIIKMITNDHKSRDLSKSLKLLKNSKWSKRHQIFMGDQKYCW